MEKNQQNNHEEQLRYVKKSDILNEFLWTCSGVNKKILRQCPTDYAKYAGIGGTILFTSLMAMLSGGYAMYTVFYSYELSIAFGVFWGLLIFNLDRFIVNTMYSDGKATISWNEFTSGLPRIIIAIFLGIVISTPLELKIFEDEINVTIEKLKKEELYKYIEKDKIEIAKLEHERDSISNSQGRPIIITGLRTSNVELNRLLDRSQELVNGISNQETKLNQIQQIIYDLERTQFSYDKDSPDWNNVHKQLQPYYSQRNDLRKSLSLLQTERREIDSQAASLDKGMRKQLEDNNTELKSRYDNLTSRIDTLHKNVSEAAVNYKEILDNEFGGFQARMSAFNTMKNENTATQITASFIMLLFILIEIVPTFFKMMIASGPYDDMLRSEMYRVRVLSNKLISDLNDEVNTAVKLSTEKNKNKLEAEAKANKELLERIAIAQTELLNTAIDLWKKEELDKVKQNPGQYIKYNNSQNTPPK